MEVRDGRAPVTSAGDKTEGQLEWHLGLRERHKVNTREKEPLTRVMLGQVNEDEAMPVINQNKRIDRALRN